MALSRKNRSKKVSRKSRRSRRYRHRGGYTSAEWMKMAADFHAQASSATTEGSAIGIKEASSASQVEKDKEAQLAAMAMASAAMGQGAAGKRVNLYFNHVRNSSNKISLTPSYSDNNELNINEFTNKVDSYLGVGFDFPAKNIMVKDIKFEAIPTNGAPSWTNIYTGDIFVNDPQSISMRDSNNKFITGAMDQKLIKNKGPLVYPNEGINLNGFKIRGLSNIRGFRTRGVSNVGAVPPDAPEGTIKANVRMSFTLV